LRYVGQVIRTKSVEFMPLSVSLGSLISSSTWTAYGLYVGDLWITWPNVVGIAVCLFALGIYCSYSGYRAPSSFHCLTAHDDQEAKALVVQAEKLFGLPEHFWSHDPNRRFIRSGIFLRFVPSHPLRKSVKKCLFVLFNDCIVYGQTYKGQLLHYKLNGSFSLEDPQFFFSVLTDLSAVGLSDANIHTSMHKHISQGAARQLKRSQSRYELLTSEPSTSTELAEKAPLKFQTPQFFLIGNAGKRFVCCASTVQEARDWCQSLSTRTGDVFLV